MYQPPQQSDSTTAPPALYNPYTGHYPTQYNLVPNPSVQQQQSLQYFPPFPHLQQPKPSPAPDLPPPPPDYTSITPGVASKAIQRLISSELLDVGFASAQADAVKRIELELVAFVEQLFLRAHEYANLSNRAGPIATDLLSACEEFNLPPKELRTVRAQAARKKRKNLEPTEAHKLLPPPSRSPSPELLPSDDEGAPPLVPSTLRMLPSYFPTLPPKHTYLQTPASPPKKAALPSLEKKLKTAGLVQESLRNLLLTTEESTNPDGELLGHTVNWEMGVHPRKRWKISR